MADYSDPGWMPMLERVALWATILFGFWWWIRGVQPGDPSDEPEPPPTQ